MPLKTLDASRLIASLSSHGVHRSFVLDEQLQPLHADPRLLAECGCTLPELQNQGWLSRVHPDDLAGLQAARQHAGHSWSCDYRWRRQDGSYRWVMAQAWRLPEQPALWQGTHTDIDERKAAEARLHHSDSLWQLALESVGDGVWDWRIQEGVEYLSERILAIYGYAPGELAPRPEELDERTHPDDREQMQRDREAHFSGRAPIYLNEHRILCKDGRWKWVLSRGMVISRDAQGQPLRMVGTHTDITQRKEQEALIRQQAHFDALTGLPNRRLMRELIEAELQGHRRRDRPLAVLFVDLDQFKEVNDTLGHDMGDALLQQAAARIRACLGPADTVARMGGDEFTVLLAEVEHRHEAEQRAQRLIDAMASAFKLGEERVFVSASVGISLYPFDGEQIETLFKHADQALYVAKSSGRNRFSHFTPELQRQAQRRHRLANELREALQRGQLHLHYQPIVALADGQVNKAEVLLRWLHPELGAISPAEFIPIAESTGQILEIGAWVYAGAHRQAALWRQTLDAGFQLSVNVSPVEFRAAGHRPDAGALRWLDVSTRPETVILEITEGVLLDPDLAVSRQLSSLRTAGAQISLDDFGTGYSSLSYLQQHAIDLIKIDQSFVRGLEPGSNSLTLCKAIIALAHDLGIAVVAEGIENSLQLDLLRRAGCDYGQGYHYAAPMAAEALEHWVQQHRRA